MGRVYNKKYGYSEAVTLVGEDGGTLGDKNSPLLVAGAPNAAPILVQNTGTAITNRTLLDTFGRQRICEPILLFDGNFSESPIAVDTQWDTQSIPPTPPGFPITALVHNPTEATVSLSCNLVGSSSTITSHKYLAHSSGASRIAYISGILDHQSLSAKSSIGIFDTNDGIFFQQDSLGNISVVARSSITGFPVETTIPREFWDDTFDGLGISGITVDFRMAQTFVIDYAPTGVGLVRVGVMQGGEFFTCLVLDGANRATVPFMRSTTLPITYHIEAVTAGFATIKTFSASCIVEGEGDAWKEGASQHSVMNALGVLPAIGILTPVASVTLKPTYPLFSTNFNRSVVKAVDVNLFDNRASYIWSLWRNATLVAPMWIDAGIRSACMTDIAATGVVLGTGTMVASGMGGKRTAMASVVLDAVQGLSVNRFTNIGDTLTLCVEDDPLKGGSTPQGSITWREEK